MRSFVGINLPSNESIALMVKRIRGLGKVVNPQNLHLTLKFLGEISEVDEIIDALDRIQIERFSITISGMGAFPSEKRGRILFVKGHPEEPLKKLAEEVDSSTRGIRLDHPFTPHITVLRARKINDFSSLISTYRDFDFFTHSVEHFTLFQSTLTPNGPIYTELKKFQLM